MEESIPNFGETANRVPVKPAKGLLIFLLVLVTVAGIATGYGFSLRKSSADVIETGPITPEKVTVGREFGSKNSLDFKDTATGILEAGGVEGEGTHKLVRDGGPSQTAYLTSSVLDLDLFIGKKVQIWGQTMQAKKAGWLMDVGRVKILK